MTYTIFRNLVISASPFLCLNFLYILSQPTEHPLSSPKLLLLPFLFFPRHTSPILVQLLFPLPDYIFFTSSFFYPHFFSSISSFSPYTCQYTQRCFFCIPTMQKKQKISGPPLKIRDSNEDNKLLIKILQLFLSFAVTMLFFYDYRGVVKRPDYLWNQFLEISSFCDEEVTGK